VGQRQAEFDLASKRLTRAEGLSRSKTISPEEFDTATANHFSAKRAVSNAKANVAASDAAIGTAKSQVIEAESSVDASHAKIERLKADINDSTLRTLRDGRVQFRVTQPGEVLSAGGAVLNMIDISDVYMTFFLPTALAGRVRMGAEARLVLDAAPQYVIPATVSFVSDVAQFTPKTVETAVEREKLMFRIRARVAPELLKEHKARVKTGLPGVAYVQLDPQAAWPERLEVRLPQ
jgi:HlyD family secretion protein